LSDPRHSHQYDPRRKDGKCKAYVGDAICGEPAEFPPHVRSKVDLEIAREEQASTPTTAQAQAEEIAAKLRSEQKVWPMRSESTYEEAASFILEQQKQLEMRRLECDTLCTKFREQQKRIEALESRTTNGAAAPVQNPAIIRSWRLR
jgi:hypothetical protein